MFNALAQATAEGRNKPAAILRQRNHTHRSIMIWQSKNLASNSKQKNSKKKHA